LIVREIVEQIVRRTTRGEAVSLCTVVVARGSTPQQAGATMLVLQDGQTLGTLGGGCVEAEVRTQALRLLGQRADRLLTFKLDHDYGWDDGLVCGGTMEIAVQTLAAPDGWLAVQADLSANRETGLDIAVPDESGQISRFRIPIDPTPTLLIAGAGHVGQALAGLMSKLDFNVVVIDDRPDCATAERFPSARRVVGEIETELRGFAITEHTYVVVVTRGHKHDAQALGAVIESPARYVGLIGSRRKVLQILRELGERGVARERLAAVHAPIGLAIGAISPAEIAVSIAAELVAVRRGRSGAVIEPMKLRPGLLDQG
jgi:xanthine dehydrogenase accessory factor